MITTREAHLRFSSFGGRTALTNRFFSLLKKSKGCTTTGLPAEALRAQAGGEMTSNYELSEEELKADFIRMANTIREHGLEEKINALYEKLTPCSEYLKKQATQK